MDVVMGYEAGADDYMVKPFSLAILISKVNAIFKRLSGDGEEKLVSGEVVFSKKEMKVFVRGEETSLTKNELRLFLILMEHPKQILSKNQLLEQIFDVNGEFVDENTIAVNIRRLREKLDEERLKLEKEETKALVTDLSHQLKTPVASIQMSFQLLEDENLDAEERREFLARLGEQIHHLEGLLSALVNISRMESGMIHIPKEETGIFQRFYRGKEELVKQTEGSGVGLYLTRKILEEQGGNITVVFPYGGNNLCDYDEPGVIASHMNDRVGCSLKLVYNGTYRQKGEGKAE